MAVTPKFRLRKGDLERIQNLLAHASPAENRRIFRRGMRACAEIVQKITTEEMIVRGRRKSPPLPDRLTDRRTGSGLIGSIAINQPRDSVAEVGSHLVYAPLHEYGLGRFPPRPFLSPALEKASAQFGTIFVETIEQELAR